MDGMNHESARGDYDMRKTMKNILCCVAWAAVLPLLTACNSEEEAVKDSATVTLSFTTRANAPAAPLASGEEGPENNLEAMQDLRIIMQRVDGSHNEILFNYFRTFTPDDQTTSTTVTFEGVPEGTYNFYAVANEPTDNSSITAEGLDALLQETLDGALRMSILNGKQAIPAAWVLEDVTVPSGTNQNLTMELIRAVAKLRVRIINETGENQTLTGIAWRNYTAASTGLFPPDGEVTATLDGTNEWENPVSIGTGADNTWQWTRYVYEGQCASAPLTFSAEWPVNKARTITLKETGKVLQRNTLLDLIITLEAAPFEMTWTYRVVPWEEVTNEVSFD